MIKSREKLDRPTSSSRVKDEKFLQKVWLENMRGKRVRECGWDDVVKGSLNEVLCVVVDWIRLDQSKN